MLGALGVVTMVTGAASAQSQSPADSPRPVRLAQAATAARGLPVGTDLILAACVRDEAGAAPVLRRLGVDPEEVLARLAQVGPGEASPPA